MPIDEQEIYSELRVWSWASTEAEHSFVRKVDVPHQYSVLPDVLAYNLTVTDNCESRRRTKSVSHLEKSAKAEIPLCANMCCYPPFEFQREQTHGLCFVGLMIGSYTQI
jgi:hypothetical protein